MRQAALLAPSQDIPAHMASGVSRAGHRMLWFVAARSCHYTARNNSQLGAALRVPTSASTMCSCGRSLSTSSAEESAPAQETSSSAETGKGQWRKWIEVKLASKEKKGSVVANDSSAPEDSNVSAGSVDVLKKGHMVAENFNSVDDFERRVLGTAWRPENEHDDDDDLLKQLDAIDRVSGGSASISADYDQDNLVYEGTAGWEEDQQTMNLPVDRGFAASEGFDIDGDKPYQFRADRLFFPGQSYVPEELDISRPEPAESDKPNNARSKRIHENSDVLRKADFRNARFLSSFISETSKIAPKRRNYISAKAQRKVIREIKTARILGLLPFTSMGQAAHKSRRSSPDEVAAPSGAA